MNYHPHERVFVSDSPARAIREPRYKTLLSGGILHSIRTRIQITRENIWRPGGGEGQREGQMILPAFRPKGSNNTPTSTEIVVPNSRQQSKHH